MADVNMDQIVDSLSNLTVMQIAQLTKKLEDKWGVKAAPVAMAAGPAAAVPVAEDGLWVSSSGTCPDHLRPVLDPVDRVPQPRCGSPAMVAGIDGYGAGQPFLMLAQARPGSGARPRSGARPGSGA